jgi:S-(hydroxymethyl)glutathione dehydrogenase/alcohol dehydrogenase
MTVSGLVAHGNGATDLTVEQITLPDPGPGEVRVRIRAAGVCHSDLSMVNGTLAPTFPLVLGHEAAGVVASVGDGVTRASVGDHVVCNWAPACRQCWFCTHGQPFLCERAPGASVPRGSTVDGSDLYATLGLGSLAQEVVVPEHAVIPIDPRMPFDEAALLGCAVLTGIGAVRNTAKVQPGESVLVIGLGGVGMSVLTGARMAGAHPIIAVDVSEAKRELALAAGATDFVVSDDNLAKAIRALTDGRGADVSFECVGRSATIRTAWRGTRRGGQVIVVGMGGRDDNVSLSALEIFHSAKTLRSSVYGSSDPDVEVPQLVDAALGGTLDLRPLVTHRIGLADAAAAFERMERGEGARSVVLLED